MPKFKIIISVLLLFTLLFNCKSIGPGAIERDRGSYVEALSLTNRQEMLANIVRAKYNQPPVFLKIKTITASPSLELGVDVDNAVGGGVPVKTNINPRIVYKEDPNIFYEPLSGKEFASEMLMPVGLLPVFLMINNGFSFTAISDLLFVSINNLTNSRNASIARREDYKKAIACFNTLFEQKLFMFQVRRSEIVDEDPTLNIYVSPEATESEAYNDLKKILKFEPKNNILPIKLGLVNDDSSLIINTRSVLALINYLSNFVVIPEKHRDIVWPSKLEMKKSPITIYSSKSKPESPNLSIFLNDYWFYIKDTDINSQNTLYLLHIVFDMQAQISNSNNLQLTLPIR